MRFNLNTLTLIVSSSLMLSACTTYSSNNSQSTTLPPSNQPVVYQATNNGDQPPNVQTQYVPVAVPGQLMPVPTTSQTAETPKFKSPTQAVDYANQQATQQPASSEFFNSMMTYNYMPGVLYTIYTAPMHITDIMLAPGEKLVSEAAGDTLRWQVAQTYSGQGSNTTQHILVKPTQSGLTNTMVITTDQRVYHIILQSTDNSYMASVQWTYGGDMVSYGNNASPTPPVASSDNNDPSVDLTNLNFNYKFGMVQGDRPSWYPVRVFNDGRQTYIQLPQNYDATQLPMLFVADDSGNFGTAVNWRYRAPYMIADVVLKNARLQTGVPSTTQTIVQIQYTGS
jgi:type IV secretion system protein TrbG